MDKEEEKIMKAAISAYGQDAQTDMAIEEMSELTKALLKFRRYGKGVSANDRLNDIREEIEDVQIMLDQMMLIYGRDLGVRCKKIERLRKRLKDGENNDRDSQS